MQRQSHDVIGQILRPTGGPQPAAPLLSVPMTIGQIIQPRSGAPVPPEVLVAEPVAGRPAVVPPPLP